jgi:hypothetical protein
LNAKEEEGIPHMHITATSRQRDLLKLMAQGRTTAEQLSEALGASVSRDEVVALIELYGARDAAEAVRRAITASHLEPPEEWKDDIEAARSVVAAMSDPVRSIVWGYGEGATAEDVGTAVGTELDKAMAVALWLGADRPRLPEQELTFLVHTLRGHVTAYCVEHCDLGTKSQLFDLRQAVMRTLRAKDLPSAVAAGLRQIPSIPELERRIADARKRGFDYDELELVRQCAAGGSYEEIAPKLGFTASSLSRRLYCLYKDLDLLVFPEVTRQAILTYIVLRAGQPRQMSTPEPVLNAQRLTVLHYCALGYPADQIATALGLQLGAVKRIIAELHQIFRSRVDDSGGAQSGARLLWMTVGRAAKAGVLRFSKAALRPIQRAKLQPPVNTILALMAMGESVSEIRERPEFADCPIDALLAAACYNAGVGTRVNLIALAVLAKQVDLSDDKFVLRAPEGQPLAEELESPLPWDGVPSHRDTRTRGSKRSGDTYDGAGADPADADVSDPDPASSDGDAVGADPGPLDGNAVGAGPAVVDEVAVGAGPPVPDEAVVGAGSDLADEDVVDGDSDVADEDAAGADPEWSNEDAAGADPAPPDEGAARVDPTPPDQQGASAVPAVAENDDPLAKIRAWLEDPDKTGASGMAFSEDLETLIDTHAPKVIAEARVGRLPAPDGVAKLLTAVRKGNPVTTTEVVVLETIATGDPLVGLQDEHGATIPMIRVLRGLRERLKVRTNGGAGLIAAWVPWIDPEVGS